MVGSISVNKYCVCIGHDMRSEDDLNRAISVVLASPTASFTTLVRIAGLDPKRSFRFAVLNNVDFSRQNIGRFNFQGADLSGCSFKDAKILGANFAGAIVDKRSLAEASDWKAYDREQRAAQVTAISEPGKEAPPQLDYERALQAFTALLRRRIPLKPETLAAMVNIAPTFPDAVVIIELMRDYRQKVTANVIRKVASKVRQPVVNAWLSHLSTHNLDPKGAVDSAKLVLAVEMSNLIGALGDDTPAQSFNRILQDVSHVEEILAVVSYFEQRDWPIFATTIEKIERKLFDALPIREPDFPTRSDRPTSIARYSLVQEYLQQRMPGQY